MERGSHFRARRGSVLDFSHGHGWGSAICRLQFAVPHFRSVTEFGGPAYLHNDLPEQGSLEKTTARKRWAKLGRPQSARTHTETLIYQHSSAENLLESLFALYGAYG